MRLIKTLQQALKMDREKFKVPRSVQQAIPIDVYKRQAYTIRNHMERNFGEQEQTFFKDDFSFEEPPKQTPKKEKKEKQPER